MDDDDDNDVDNNNNNKYDNYRNENLNTVKHQFSKVE
jgi:hypothetical protein